MTRGLALAALARGAALLAVAALAGCAGANPRVLSPGDAAAGCGPTSPAPCEALCFRDRAAACALFGTAVAGGSDPPVRLPQDRPRARRALERGCALGSLDACRELASLDSDVAAPGQDCAAWESVCQRGDQRSCSHLAQCLLRSNGFRQDRAQAKLLLDQGCARGERMACRDLGLLSLRGEDVPKDAAKAFALFDGACRLDDQVACVGAAHLLERGEGVARDVERAKDLQRTACKRGVWLACEALRRLGETPPAAALSSADAAESLYASARYGYDWLLPANWALVAPSSVNLHEVPAEAEAVAARPRGGASRDSLLFVVTDATAIAPGKAPAMEALDGLEEHASKWLLLNGVSRSGGSRTKLHGIDVARVDGQLGAPGLRYVSLLLFVKDSRRFELRCLTEQPQPGLPCADALGALTFRQPKPSERTALHLREPRLGLSFDAPSDAWVGHAPLSVLGGRERVWVWTNEGRRIEVSTLEPGDGRQTAFIVFVSSMVEVLRKAGAAVVTTEEVLAGQPCTHLQVEKGTAHQDFLLQRRRDVIYGVFVSAPTRDAELLARARAGLRLDEPAP